MNSEAQPRRGRVVEQARRGQRFVRMWMRIPEVARAVTVGFTVLVAGNFIPQGLFAANLRWPGLPWSAVFIAAYLWAYWRYIGGRWWPRSTSESRRHDLRATSLTPLVWLWSLVAGAFGIGALTTLTYAVARLVPLGLDFPDVLKALPPVTLVTMIVTISMMAGIVEEAAFRGYMQSRLERRHGPTRRMPRPHSAAQRTAAASRLTTVMTVRPA